MNAALTDACNYALIKFLPFPETGEFVNVGVVMHCPGRRFFEAKLEENDFRRIWAFFPAVDQRSFHLRRIVFADDVNRVGELISAEPDPVVARRIFKELVRIKESEFRFGEIRTILTQNVQGVAEELFARYVRQNLQLSAELAPPMRA